ncbi:MAG: sugar transferase [Clostridia bacterium]|nr:sugar transferase [Clostridia bacterium]MBQ9946578.1 sugar transferase [Clostridia bacterium]
MIKKKLLKGDTKNTLRFIESALEVIILSVVYFAIWKLCYSVNSFPAYLGNGKLLLTAVYAVLCWLFIKNSDGFRFGNLKISELGIAQWIGLAIVNVITYFQLCLIANKMINPLPMIGLMLADMLIATLFVFCYNNLHRRLYAPHNMIMIFGRETAVGMKIKMDKLKEKYQVTKLISADEGLDAICEKIKDFESVIINDVEAELRNDILKYCYENGIRTYVIPKITDIIMRGASPVTAFDTPMLLVNGTGLNVGQRFLKRAMDIAISLIGLIVASPIMLVVALAIKLEDKGPVFYKQKRVTLNGDVFEILKFRSMIVNAEKDGLSIPATGKDPRITKVGNIIRATRIDELPQIINILKGDMSIVGPRPERVEHVEKYSEEIPEFAYRLKVKGGLTGYAQIYGKYNTSAYDKLRLDLMYIENYSIFLDIKLIILTVRIMLSKESTEGFDVAEANERKLHSLLNELHEKGSITEDTEE